MRNIITTGYSTFYIAFKYYIAFIGVGGGWKQIFCNILSNIALIASNLDPQNLIMII